MHFEEWLAPQFAQTSLAKNWAGYAPQRWHERLYVSSLHARKTYN